MEQLPIKVCFETLLFPSSPICSNFQFSVDSSSDFAFSVLSALRFYKYEINLLFKKKQILINNHINKFY